MEMSQPLKFRNERVHDHRLDFYKRFVSSDRLTPIVNSTLSTEEGAGDIRQLPLARQIAPAIRAVLAALLVGP